MGQTTLSRSNRRSVVSGVVVGVENALEPRTEEGACRLFRAVPVDVKVSQILMAGVPQPPVL